MARIGVDKLTMLPSFPFSFWSTSREGGGVACHVYYIGGVACQPYLYPGPIQVKMCSSLGIKISVFCLFLLVAILAQYLIGQHTSSSKKYKRESFFFISFSFTNLLYLVSPFQEWQWDTTSLLEAQQL